MALRYKTRRRWSLILLLVGLPAYVVLCVSVLTALPRLSFWLELAVYVSVGLGWVLPLRAVVRGIGQGDPDGSDEAP